MCKAILTLTIQRLEEVFARGSVNCLIKVLLNNKLSSVLLDTGAQVSVIRDKCLRQNFPHVGKYTVNELLDKPDSWSVQWGKSDRPFSKYTVASLCIGEGDII